MNRKTKRKLEALYNSLPKFSCKGLCQDSCTMIGMSKAEAQYMREEGSRQLPVLRPDGHCSLLGPKGECQSYVARPLICRLYGMTPEMTCPFGCEPVMARTHGYELMTKAERLGGATHKDNYYNDPKVSSYLDEVREGFKSIVGPLGLKKRKG